MVRTKPTTPPADNEKIVSATFRMPGQVLARLDAYATEMMRKTPGLNLTRSDAARVLILKALDENDKSATK